MSDSEEPTYRTAYKSGQGLLCPECGHDFKGETREALDAHIEGVHPGFNLDKLQGEAKRRVGILQEIRKELES